jgi:hypothetical protein
MCRDGPACTRQICFFAHDEGQLREATPDASAPPLADQRKQQRGDAKAHQQQQLAAQRAGLAPNPRLSAAAQQQCKLEEARARVTQHLMSLQQQQERADILRAVREAAAETGFVLLPPAPLNGGGPVGCSPLGSSPLGSGPLGSLTAAAALLAAPAAAAIDAVCDAPGARWPGLASAQRAPGAPPQGGSPVCPALLQRLLQAQSAAAAAAACGPSHVPGLPPFVGASAVAAGLPGCPPSDAAALPGFGPLSSYQLPAAPAHQHVLGDWQVTGPAHTSVVNANCFAPW